MSYRCVTMLSVLTASVGLCPVAGCGSSPRGDAAKDQVVAGYAPRMAPIREQLAALAGKLPPAGTRPETRKAAPDPVPVFERHVGKYNTEILMADQLADVESRALPNYDSFNMARTSDLLTCLRWTGSGPLSKSYRYEPGAPKIAARFEAALSYRYLVALRQVAYTRPKLTFSNKGPAEFTAGAVDLDVFVFDLRSGELIAAGRAAGTTDAQVKYATAGGLTQSEIESKLHDRGWRGFRQHVADTLTDITGGKFFLEGSLVDDGRY